MTLVQSMQTMQVIKVG